MQEDGDRCFAGEEGDRTHMSMVTIIFVLLL